MILMSSTWHEMNVKVKLVQSCLNLGPHGL